MEPFLDPPPGHPEEAGGEGSTVPFTPSEGSKSVSVHDETSTTDGTLERLEPLSPYTSHTHASAHADAHTRAYGALNADGTIEGSVVPNVPPSDDDANQHTEREPAPADEAPDEEATWDF
jgi:hypothetical protein